jgi:hypothetical protein
MYLHVFEKRPQWKQALATKHFRNLELFLAPANIPVIYAAMNGMF